MATVKPYTDEELEELKQLTEPPSVGSGKGAHEAADEWRSKIVHEFPRLLARYCELLRLARKACAACDNWEADDALAALKAASFW